MYAYVLFGGLGSAFVCPMQGGNPFIFEAPYLHDGAR